MHREKGVVVDRLQLVLKLAQAGVRGEEPGEEQPVPPRRGGRDRRDDLARGVGEVHLLREPPAEVRLAVRRLVRDPPHLDRAAVRPRSRRVGRRRRGGRELQKLGERRGVQVPGRGRDLDVVDRAFELRERITVQRAKGAGNRRVWLSVSCGGWTPAILGGRQSLGKPGRVLRKKDARE